MPVLRQRSPPTCMSCNNRVFTKGEYIRNTPYSVIPCGFGLALGSFILPLLDHASGGSPAHPNTWLGQRKRVFEYSDNATPWQQHSQWSQGAQVITTAGKALGRGCCCGAQQTLEPGLRGQSCSTPHCSMSVPLPSGLPSSPT